ncbi:MAG: hypothetical protein HW380_2452 [Magnetococcales bacterium]|nr:hypothetical protein [Magnetococcales bacterium]
MAISANHEAGDVSVRFQAGFTLLELLVALSVFVVLSIMAYQGLSNMLFTRDIIEEKTQNLHELQMAFLLLDNDLEQTVARTVVGMDGKVEPAFRGGEQTNTWLVLTRCGRANPRGDVRSEFQRVAWLFEGGALIRRSWQRMDALGENPYHEEILVQGVLNLEVMFLDDKGAKAVEIIMEKRGVGRIRRIIELPPAPRWM